MNRIEWVLFGFNINNIVKFDLYDCFLAKSIVFLLNDVYQSQAIA